MVCTQTRFGGRVERLAAVRCLARMMDALDDHSDTIRVCWFLFHPISVISSVLIPTMSLKTKIDIRNRQHHFHRGMRISLNCRVIPALSALLRHTNAKRIYCFIASSSSFTFPLINLLLLLPKSRGNSESPASPDRSQQARLPAGPAAQLRSRPKPVPNGLSTVRRAS